MERYCKLQLQKFRLEQADITHVCIAPNLYPLLQYLLLMDDDVVFNHTYYFINEVIPEKVCEELPCSCYEHYGKSFGQKLYRWYLKIRLRFFKYIDYPFLKTAELYAYDMPFLSLCIGNRSYSLLSDAPNWMTLNVQLNSPIFQGQQKKATSFWGKIQRLVLGDVFVNYWGNNKQCKAVYLTEKNVTPILDDKTVFIQSLESLYKNSSDKKRQFIMALFNITCEDVETINAYDNLFFSQPLMKDCGLTEDEYIEVLQKIFQHYPLNSIAIKTHPRDDFDYKKYFPGLFVYSKSINSQLLYLTGVKPKKIITIASSAIDGFPESIECDYYGVSIHSKIEKYLGSGFAPKRKVNHITVN